MCEDFTHSFVLALRVCFVVLPDLPALTLREVSRFWLWHRCTQIGRIGSLLVVSVFWLGTTVRRRTYGTVWLASILTRVLGRQLSCIEPF